MNSPRLKKVELQIAPRRSVSAITRKGKIDPAPEERVQKAAFWRAEIEAISGQRFASLKDALSQIADSVLNRLGADGSRRESEKKFLIDLFVTDKQLCEDVRLILKIS